jgi:uncharacterized phage protein (TIGR02220 family)
MKRPSFQFYPGDWLNDAPLRMVSIGARGLWIDMLCIMHQGSDYGHLKVNGKVILPANLARMTGTTSKECEGYLDELESAGVFSRDDEGCIFSRRMIRDEKTREARAAGGFKGGNPALMGEKKVNLQSNLEITPSSSSSSSLKKTSLSGSPDDAQEVLEHLNSKTGRHYRPVAANTDLIRNRLREGASVEDCKAVIDAKHAEWGHDPKMAAYLRPATLFNASKFAQYVGQLGAGGSADNPFAEAL